MPVSQSKPPGVFVETSSTRRELAQLELFAEWLDRRYIDPLLGFLLPGAGDTLGSLLGLYGVWVAARLGTHPIVLARMLLNLAIDSLLGSIPFLGVIFDIFFRAHVRNLELLKQRGERGEPRLSDWVIVGGAAFLFLFALILPILLVTALIVYLISRFFG